MKKQLFKKLLTTSATVMSCAIMLAALPSTSTISYENNEALIENVTLTDLIVSTPEPDIVPLEDTSAERNNND